MCGQKKMAPMLEIVPAKAHMLGANECTFGPSYWCATRANAKKCKVGVYILTLKKIAWAFCAKFVANLFNLE